jgi:ABC-type branched-subunit amino acid transport system substrate-binding protein
METNMFLARARRALLAVACVVAATTAHSQDIVLGQTASIKNPLVGSLSREYNTGIELALRRANAAGGIKGRKLRLEMFDDNFDANLAVAGVKELVEKHNIAALVGAMGTQPVMKMAAEGTLEKHQLASIGPMTGLQAALSKPNVFPVRRSYEDEVLAMMTHSAQLGRSRLAYLYYEAGVGPQMAKLVPEMARQAQVQLTGVVGFPVIGDPASQRGAVAKAIDQLPAVAPQAIILLAIGPAHTEALKVVRERLGQGMPVYSLGQVNAAALVKDAGVDIARGVMLTQVMPMPGALSHPIAREFEADRKRFAPDQPAGYMLMEGYVVGRVATEIVRRAKKPTRESVLQAAEQAGTLNVGGFIVNYQPESRRSVNPIELTMIGRGGKLVR